MSDSSQILEDNSSKTDQEQEEVPSINNDELQMIPLESKRTIEEESCHTSDSEYEDVEDEGNQLPSISNKTSSKITTDEDERRINLKPRRTNKNRQNDECSEGDDEDDNQNVPNTKETIISDVNKSDRNKGLAVDDDNNTQSPAYIPRKGKFYEHDDRTSNENDPSKQEISKNTSRSYKDFDGKWQHDLYFQDEQIAKSRRSFQPSNRDHYERNYNGYREQPNSNNYMTQSRKGRDNYSESRYYNDYYRQVPLENYKKSPNTPMANFDLKDYDRSASASYHRHGYNSDTTIQKDVQKPPHRQQHDRDTHQNDERIFHRRRNFTNSQFQQQDHHHLGKFNSNFIRNDQRRSDEQWKENNDYETYGRRTQQSNQDSKRNGSYESKTNLPPRLQTNNNHRNLIQKQHYQQNLSPDTSNNERPRRYSNMRNTMTNFIQQPTLSSQMQHYQNQRSNNLEQNDWPQAPPPPIPFLSQQIITPQMFYQQQQSSRYAPMNCPQTSTSQQGQEKK